MHGTPTLVHSMFSVMTAGVPPPPSFPSTPRLLQPSAPKSRAMEPQPRPIRGGPARRGDSPKTAGGTRVAWSQHPIAYSGGVILPDVLRNLGHDAINLACFAAVCPGWRAAADEYRATTTTNLQSFDAASSVSSLGWSPCGKYVVATACTPPKICLWEATTGAKRAEWGLTVPMDIQTAAAAANLYGHGMHISSAFSRDSTLLLTLVDGSNYFSVWSVPAGHSIAKNVDNSGHRHGYQSADLGVDLPGSASAGLIGFGTCTAASVHLWDIHYPPEGPAQLLYRDRVQLARHGGVRNFHFSPDGSKFAAACFSTAYLYDVESLTSLGRYDPFSSPRSSPRVHANLNISWAPSSRRVVVSWHDWVRDSERLCIWDFNRPEAPPVVDVSLDAETRLQGWTLDAAENEVATCFAIRTQRPTIQKTRSAPVVYALEERRFGDKLKSIIRTTNLHTGTSHDDVQNMRPDIILSPDSNALLLCLPGAAKFLRASSRIIKKF